MPTVSSLGKIIVGLVSVTTLAMHGQALAGKTGRVVRNAHPEIVDSRDGYNTVTTLERGPKGRAVVRVYSVDPRAPGGPQIKGRTGNLVPKILQAVQPSIPRGWAAEVTMDGANGFATFTRNGYVRVKVPGEAQGRFVSVTYKNGDGGAHLIGKDGAPKADAAIKVSMDMARRHRGRRVTSRVVDFDARGKGTVVTAVYKTKPAERYSSELSGVRVSRVERRRSVAKRLFTGENQLPTARRFVAELEAERGKQVTKSMVRMSGSRRSVMVTDEIANPDPIMTQRRTKHRTRVAVIAGKGGKQRVLDAPDRVKTDRDL